MTYPRSLLANPTADGVDHCVSCYARRAWRCGEAAHTQRNFDHLRQWVQDQLALLADWFAILVYSFAVFSGHLRTVGGVEFRIWNSLRQVITHRVALAHCGDKRCQKRGPGRSRRVYRVANAALGRARQILRVASLSCHCDIHRHGRSGTFCCT